MSINAILQTAVSALQTNQSALRTTSTNVANVNNPEYVRRDVVLESLNVGGSPVGVKVAEVRRIATTVVRLDAGRVVAAGGLEQLKDADIDGLD